MPNQPHFLSPSGPAHRRIDYQAELNPAQYRAVTTTDGPVLVIAGAGSGKTRTLVYRLAYLVDQGVEPSAILLLTFTRQAAHEMLARPAPLLDNPGIFSETAPGRTLRRSRNPHPSLNHGLAE